MFVGNTYERYAHMRHFPKEMYYICAFSGLTCAGLAGSPLAFQPRTGAESSGEVLIHHTADVPLVVGKQNASRAQVLSFPHLLFLLSA